MIGTVKNYDRVLVKAAANAESSVLDISGCNKLVIQVKKAASTTCKIQLLTSVSDVNHGWFDEFSTASARTDETFMKECIANTLVIKVVDFSGAANPTINVMAVGV